MPNDGQSAGQNAGQGAGQSTDGAGQNAAGGAGQQSGQAAPWHGLTDPDALSYIQNKGWTNPADVIKSYQGAEKLIGRDPSQVLVLPRADDPDGMRQVFQKLGKPEKPDAYNMKLGLPDGAKVDEGFAKSMQQLLHKADITEAQAKTLISDYNSMLAAAAAQQAKDYELNVQADKQALLDEWKGGHDRMMGKAKAAAQSLGFAPELIDAIEKQVGYAKTHKMFAEIGAKLGEDGLVTTGGKTPSFDGMLTPAEAKAQWDQSKLDPNFVAALTNPQHPGHKAAQEKQTRLFKVMYPDG